jgi:hypothetical protein
MQIKTKVVKDGNIETAKILTPNPRIGLQVVRKHIDTRIMNEYSLITCSDL